MNDRPSLDWAAVRQRANEDAEFRQHARFWNATIRLVVGRKATRLRVEGGAVASIEPWFGAIAADLSISASEEQWAALLAKTPAPFYQDLYPAAIHHGFEVAGSVSDYCAYYPAIRRLIELLRNADEDAVGRRRRTCAKPRACAAIRHRPRPLRPSAPCRERPPRLLRDRRFR